ncbi:MAG: hypothetical protein MUC62_06220 [Candidatus Thermoplasmatota archaeon]|jgi:hypothetical protein|nr:hypothetical protein [Candidatus Thermoplasmatota archaeon]
MNEKIISGIILSLLVLFNICSIIIAGMEEISLSYNFKTINGKVEQYFVYIPIPSFPHKINKNIKKEPSPYGSIYNITISNNIDFHIKEDKYSILRHSNFDIGFSTSEPIRDTSPSQIWIYQGQKENLTIEFKVNFKFHDLAGESEKTYFFFGNLTYGWNKIPLSRGVMHSDTFLCGLCLFLNIIIIIIDLFIISKYIINEKKEEIVFFSQMATKNRNSTADKSIQNNKVDQRNN